MRQVLVSRGHVWLEIETVDDGLAAGHLSGTFVAGYVREHLTKKDGTRFLGLMAPSGDVMPVILMVGNGKTSRNLVCGMHDRDPYPAYGPDIQALSDLIGVPLSASDYPYVGLPVPWLPSTSLPLVLRLDGHCGRWVELSNVADDNLAARPWYGDREAPLPCATREAERAAGVRFLALASERTQGPEHFTVTVRIPPEDARRAGELPTVVASNDSDPYDVPPWMQDVSPILALGGHLGLDLSRDAVRVPSIRPHVRPAGGEEPTTPAP